MNLSAILAAIGLAQAAVPVSEPSGFEAHESQRRSTISVDLTATGMRMSGELAGDPIDKEVDDFKMSAEVVQKLAFSDRLGKSSEGQEQLRRRIEEALCEQTVLVGDLRKDAPPRVSPLKGEELVFQKTEEGAWALVVPTEQEATREQDLAALSYGPPLRELFPVDELKDDPDWSLPRNRLSDILCPGGNLFPASTAPFKRAEASASVSSISWFFAATMLLPPAVLRPKDGEITAKYEGVHELEAGEMHVVQLAVDVTCEVDCSAYLERNLAAQLPPDRSYDYSHNLSLSLKGTGTLWQGTTASGHPHPCSWI